MTFFNIKCIANYVERIHFFEKFAKPTAGMVSLCFLKCPQNIDVFCIKAYSTNLNLLYVSKIRPSIAI